MVIGITGKSGTGKTTVAEFIGDKLNYKVIHGDELAHEALTLEFYNEILTMFGLPKETSVNRKRLGELLFNNKEMMDKYNILINERILNLFKEKTLNESNYIIDWNFLTISELWDLCDKKILLIAGDSIRKERVVKRDNISDDYFLARDKAGLEYKSSDFDIVTTSGDILTGIFELERLGK